MQQVELKHLKICLLGSKKVGKTFLAHKLVDLDYDQYLSTKECQKFTKQFSQKMQTLIYYDFPPIRNELIQQLTSNHVFDVIVCLFKDSTSFGQLYEFFQLISKKTEENNHQFNNYWQKIRNFILVYSDFDQILQVQIQQLFKVLIGQIRNFNRSATIKQFVLKPRLQNYQYLRQLIQKNRYQEHTSKENITSATEITINIQHNQQKVSDKITEKVCISPHEKQIQTINQQKRNEDDDMFIPILTQVKLASGKEKLLDTQKNISQDDNFHTLGKSQQGLQHSKNNLNSQQGQVFRNFTIDQLQTSYRTMNDQSKINQTEQFEQQVYQYKQLQTKTKNLQEQNKKMAFQINKTQQMNINNDIFKHKIERQQDQQQEKQKQHYREVFNKLVQKINNEQIQQSKKTSYQNLFEQFRQTSKDESKITKQLKEYWQKKIYKLQEEDEDDEAEAALANQEEDQIQQLRYNAAPSQQEKPHPRSAGNKHKKYGQPLKPQSSFDGVTYKRQKKAPESKPCFCLIM